MSSAPDSPSAAPPKEKGPHVAGGDGMTIAVAVVAAAAAVALMAFGGWQLWDRSTEPPASVPMTRLGVLFAPNPVPPADGGEAGGAGSSDPPGLLVIAVDADGTAQRCGVRPGDVWLTIAGQPLCDEVDPQSAAARVGIVRELLGPGFAMEATLRRNGEPRALTLRDDAPPLSSAPPAPDFPWLPPNRGYLGVGVLMTAPDEPGEPPGTYVSLVTPGSPGEEAGLRVGDRLVALAAEPTADETLSEMADALVRLINGEGTTDAVATSAVDDRSYLAASANVRPGETFRLTLLRHGRPLTLPVRFVSGDELPRYRHYPPLGL